MIDLVFVLLLTVAAPFYSVASIRRMRRRLEMGMPNVRSRSYLRTIMVQAILVGLLLVHWFQQGRTPQQLGLRSPDPVGGWIVAFMLLWAAVLMLRTWQRVAVDEKLQQEVLAGFGPLASMLPHTRREWQRGLSLSLVVGCTEEVAFRGFLIWWLQPVLDPWLGLIAVAVVFGVAHVYQGLAGAVRVGFAGVVFGVVYVGSNSLWMAMALHALIDAHAFTLSYLVHRSQNAETADDADRI